MGIGLVDFVPWGSGMLGWSESAFQRRFGCYKLGVVSDPDIIIIIKENELQSVFIYVDTKIQG